MSYRPEGWGNPHLIHKENPTFRERREGLNRYNDYEAGADAYEKGLKEEGIFTYGAGHYPDIEVPKEVSGYWCFIPDEAEGYKKATTVEFTADDIK